jgi:glycerate 2-kinase
LAIITNRVSLENKHHKYHSLKYALCALESAIKHVQPEILIRRALKSNRSKLLIQDIRGNKQEFDLDSFKSVFVVGAGKGTAKMAKAVCHILKGKVTNGAINVPYGNKIHLDSIYISEANHPIPDEAGLEGTKRIINILKNTHESDLVFVLISGGGSALMPFPVNNLTLEEKKKITNKMLASGASIDEINVVRKHLSLVKGGQLVRYVKRGCTVVSLILSDVIGDNMDTIASGPTLPDSSTFKDAALILQKYHMFDNKKVEKSSLSSIINSGLEGSIDDTPKPGNSIFDNVYNFLIGNNTIACNKAVQILRKNKIQAIHLGSSFDGQAIDFGKMLGKLTNDLAVSSLPIAFVLGGETTVKLNSRRENGIGGRNQEAILSAATKCRFQDRDDITLLCMETDGIDGNSTAAGGILTPKTIYLTQKRNINIKKSLKNHDSYTALKKIDSLLFTGRTGTNVSDIAIICILKRIKSGI